MTSKLIVITLMAAGLVSTMAANPSPLAPPSNGTATSEAADRNTTQKIRKAVIADKTLSTYAHNVKIVARHGKVALRGPVRSEAEKRTVAELATQVVGTDNVTNELTIQPAK